MLAVIGSNPAIFIWAILYLPNVFKDENKQENVSKIVLATVHSCYFLKTSIFCRPKPENARDLIQMNSKLVSILTLLVKPNK